MKKNVLWVGLLTLLLLPSFSTPSEVPTVHTIGDSTMAPKDTAGNPERGWGMALPLFFKEDAVRLVNHARNGRSTKSFLDEGRWQTVLDQLKPGDYVLIQFGHNDEKKDKPVVYAAPDGAYKHNLARFIRETRAKGAYPVLMTPIVRRHFNEKGELIDTHGAYPGVVRALADSLKVPLIDMEAKSRQLIQALGDTASRALFVWTKPGEYPAIPNGRQDNTHLVDLGAQLIASLAVEGIQKLGLPLAKALAYDHIRIQAPFPMPPLRVYRFPMQDFPITRYGAKTGDGHNNTDAIAQAIQACHEAGGGRVVIPKGEWWTGPIHFRSGVNLHLEEGAVVRFVDAPNAYLPAVKTSWEGLECFNYSPLVYAYECENIAITGKGTLQPKMDHWKTWFIRPASHMDALKQLYTQAATNVPVEARQMAVEGANLRPHLIHFNRCRNVLLEDFSIRESPFWTIHIYHCDGGVFRNLNVRAHGHNNDGIDLEMTRNVLVEGCTFDQGDDAVVIKAGRNQDAWRLNRPTENIVVRNCTILNGHCLLGIGSEMSGGVRNVYMHDCTAPEDVRRFFYLKTNHRRGGFIEHVYLENVHSGRTLRLLEIDTDVLYQWRDLVPTYDTCITRIEHIYLRNVTCDTTDAVYELKGDARLPIRHVEISNVQVGTVKQFVKAVSNATDIVEKGLVVGTDFSGGAYAPRTSYRFDFTGKRNDKDVIYIPPYFAFDLLAPYGFDFNTQPGNGKPFFFSVTLPEGNYRVKVVLGNDSVASTTTVKAESRRLMCLNVPTKKGQYVTQTFAVNIRNTRINRTESVRIKPREVGKLIWDDKLTLEFNGEHPSVAAIEIEKDDQLPVIFLAGNSTVVDQSDEPWCGWGQAFPLMLSDQVAVANHAESGLSATTFLSQKRFDKVLTQLKPGDYLFIEFGHNDEKETGPGKGPYASYKANLKKLVDGIRAKGATPVLVTPMHRRRFDEQGRIVNTHGDYPDAMRQLAREEGVALIDLTAMSKTLYEAMGEEGSLKAFVHYPAHTFTGQEVALADNTHFNFYGGYEIARCVVKGIMNSTLPLKKWVKKPYRRFRPAKPDPVESFRYPLTPSFEVDQPDGN